MEEILLQVSRLPSGRLLLRPQPAAEHLSPTQRSELRDIIYVWLDTSQGPPCPETPR